MFTVLGWIVVGWIAGHLALWMFPPQDPVPGWHVIGYGAAGSIVGGMVSSTLSGDVYAPAGILMSAIGAMLVVLGVRWFQENQTDG